MSDRIEIRVPDIGDFSDVPVIEVLVKEGDRVAAEQSLITLESDKATMEVPSPAAGVVTELRVAVDDTVSEGDLVVVLDAEGASEEAEAESKPEPEPESKPEPEPESKPEPETLSKAEAESSPDKEETPEPRAAKTAEPSAGSRRSPPVSLGADSTLPSRVPYASPAIRALARELGVDLFKVSGSGRNGRILREDVTAFVKSVLQGGAPAAAPGLEVAPLPEIDFSQFGEVEKVALSRIKKIGGRNLHRNWVTIPHVTHNDHADITAMEEFRQAHKAKAKEQGFNLTPLVFLIKAVVAGLREYPQFGASLHEDGQHLVLKHYFHIGIAVDTPKGLVVPVIRDCDAKGLMELAEELAATSQRARDGKLTPDDWQGACFTISSLGGIGGDSFSPIINAPEVAILGVSRSNTQPVWDGEAFQPRLLLPLSLSYDHRVIDGAEAARFTRFLAQYLEDGANLEL